MAEGRSPYLFLVGCPRSGTTMLQSMLDRHPELAVANDSHFVTQVAEAWTEGGDLALTEAVVAQATGYATRSGKAGFHRLGLSDEAVSAAIQAPDYRSFVCRLYEEFAASRGKRFGGDKTPDHVLGLPFLHELFPWARLVHIVRDGRDVALSLLEWANPGRGPGRYALWAAEPVAVAALWWRRLVQAGRRDGVSVGAGVYHEIAYEALVEQPDAVLRGLCEHLGLTYDRRMLEYGPPPANVKRHADLPPIRGLRDWRRDLGEPQTQLFECLAGDALVEFGYELSGTAPTEEVRRLADRCRAWWRWKVGA